LLLCQFPLFPHLCGAFAVDFVREGGHQRKHVLNQLLLVAFAQHVFRPLNLDAVTGEECFQEGEVEAGQAVFVVYHDFLDLLLLHQLEQGVEFGSGVAHP